MRIVENLSLLVPLSESLGSQHLDVLWEPQPPDPASARVAAYIDERWDHYTTQAAAQGKSLFNGPITCLLDVRADLKTPRITLHLGLSDYKTFVVTRLRDRPWFEAHAPEALAMAWALGNSTLLTRGNEALLGLRSQRVSAYAGRLHMFGGVVDALGTPQFPASTQGLIAHLKLELREEAGLAAEELAPDGPRLLGVALDEFLGQPEVFWQWESHVALETVAARMDPEEHAGHRIVTRGEMTDPLWQTLTPVARHAWQVWSNS